MRLNGPGSINCCALDVHVAQTSRRSDCSSQKGWNTSESTCWGKREHWFFPWQVNGVHALWSGKYRAPHCRYWEDDLFYFIFIKYASLWIVEVNNAIVIQWDHCKLRMVYSTFIKREIARWIIWIYYKQECDARSKKFKRHFEANFYCIWMKTQGLTLTFGVNFLSANRLLQFPINDTQLPLCSYPTQINNYN